MSAFNPTKPRGIRVTPGELRHYVCTDNVTGWFDGWTHSTGFGQGYMVTTRFILKDWVTVLNGSEVNRSSKAVFQEVFPWGWNTHYTFGTETQVLHGGRRILSLRFSWGNRPAPAGEIRPLWYSPWEKQLWEEHEGFSLLVPQTGSGNKKSGESDHLLARKTGAFQSYAPPEIPKGSEWIGQYTEVAPSSITLHLCFGQSRDELIENLHFISSGNTLEREVSKRINQGSQAFFLTNDESYNEALWWAQQSSYSFVTQEYGTGIWAGLPWFKDNWGRDTFIALPGTLLVTGKFSDSKNVLFNFARFQNSKPDTSDFGRIPNRVNRQEILYNTVDGTPWLIRELWEYMEYTGDSEISRDFQVLVDTYIRGVREKGFVDSRGLLSHDDADTWMDARINGNQPWSPRGPYAVEIQALWYCAQWVASRVSDLNGFPQKAREYHEGAQLTKESFSREFVHKGILVDCLRENGIPDTHIRPNALMVALIPFDDFVDKGVLRKTTGFLVRELLLPHGILSLSPDHPWFHPVHESPVHYHKDAAYHNGTIWGWNAGFAITALCRAGWQDLAWELTKNLANQILNIGTLGTMSELVDPCLDSKGNPVPSGTFSQSWSTAEFTRNSWQDYLGVRPSLLNGSIHFTPSIPGHWESVECTIPFGLHGEVLTVQVSSESREGNDKRYTWTIETDTNTIPDVFFHLTDHVTHNTKVYTPKWENRKLSFSYELAAVPAQDLPPFAPPVTLEKKWLTLEKNNVLYCELVQGKGENTV